MADQIQPNSVTLAADLTIAWLGNPNVRALAEDVPAFFKAIHGTIRELSSSVSEPSEAVVGEQTLYAPAVSVKRSLASKDHLISLIDGKPYKTLRRHLAGHGLTPDQYRERYSLKPDYPMTAPSYSEARRAMALKIGLGDKGRASRPAKPQTTRVDKSSTAEPAIDTLGTKQLNPKSAGRGRRAGNKASESTSVAGARKRGRRPKSAAPAA